MKKNKANKKHTVFYIVAGCIAFLVVTYSAFISWATSRFCVTLKEILYTVLSPMKGAETDFFSDALKTCIPVLITFIVVWIAYVIIDIKLNKRIDAVCHVKIRKKEYTLDLFNVVKKAIILFMAISFIVTTVKVEMTYKVIDYVSSYYQQTTIYEDYYIDPQETTITAPEKPKNLIRIYLESMETTYASVDAGGFQPTNNYIQHLTDYAKENISFSNTDKLGGFKSLSGTTWTMGSLFATSSGVPFSFPVERNSMNSRSTFAEGIVTLGDILEGFGYKQEFLCGSDGDFAGRKDYFMQHGSHQVFDIYSAKAANYIPDDYYVWWGYEDSYLYEIAKDEITRLYEEDDQPFNFTMLTVDTHHVDGYVCNFCPSTYNNQLENVLTCADMQIYNFIEWCKKQPFYEDTVIIISGDHPRMDTTLVGEVEYLDRTIYNCFINTDKSAEGLKLTNRDFTAMDMFPTVLSALNFKIEGNRLGLGTDLFSGQETLSEQLGVDYLEDEIKKYSQYYIDKFA